MTGQQVRHNSQAYLSLTVSIAYRIRPFVAVLRRYSNVAAVGQGVFVVLLDVVRLTFVSTREYASWPMSIAPFPTLFFNAPNCAHFVILLALPRSFKSWASHLFHSSSVSIGLRRRARLLPRWR
mmetsp:Transcript_14667/g.31886  ORF Transcript_14667/g.31886 Transcript_14667/m.31886 type:complete len:124 (-) Transcript_14667:76-447(-)